jgi:hypothetical protein
MSTFTDKMAPSTYHYSNWRAPATLRRIIGAGSRSSYCQVLFVEDPLLGYIDIQDDFVSTWLWLKRSVGGAALSKWSQQNTARSDRATGIAAICRTFMRSVFFMTITRGNGFIDRNRRYRPCPNA